MYSSGVHGEERKGLFTGYTFTVCI